MSDPKVKYLPLFEPGFHDIEIENIENIFVTPFGTDQRKHLHASLIKFINKLKSFGIELELWIDGSFSTNKPNPNDVDLAICATDSALNNLTADQFASFFNLINNKSEAKVRYNCDVFFFKEDQAQCRSYWRGWFGFSRDEAAKGIPRVWIKP